MFELTSRDRIERINLGSRYEELKGAKYPQHFVIKLHWIGFDCIQLGFHICFWKNIEIHVPFGFLRIGWEDL